MTPLTVKAKSQTCYMGRLNRYILKNAAISISGLVIFAVCVLLLERLLRIFELISNSSNPASDATTMVLNLLPYYLGGVAVPMALLLGTIITVDRLSKSSELTAALGAGVSLFHMTKPFMLLAAFMAGLTLLLEGYLTPVGRYNYRQTEYLVKQQSYTAIFREGTFTKIGSRTFFAGTEGEDGAIGPIFIYEMIDKDDDTKGYRNVTAEVGKISLIEEGPPVLNLATGDGFQIVDTTLSGQSGFAESAIAIREVDDPYRARGDDEREMTSGELFKNRHGTVTQKIDVNTNNAALHLRLAKAVLLLLLPFIAVPFGLNYGRNPSAAGIFVGVVFLVSLQKALDFAQSLGASGKIPPWSGIWGIIALVAIGAFFLFRKSAYKMGQPPLTSFSHWVGHIKDEIWDAFKKLTRDRRIKPDV